MDLFNTIGNAIGSGAATLGNAVTAPLGVLGLASGQKPPNPQSMTNSVDPRLTQMRDQQTQQAEDYGKNLSTTEASQQQGAADTSRQALAQQLAGVTKGSNSRGMLYGSYNQGQQAQTTAKNAADLQQTKANINTNAQNTLSQLQDQALGTGIAINQSNQAEQNSAYQMALAEQMSNNQAFGGLISGLGSFGGLLAGRGLG